MGDGRAASDGLTRRQMIRGATAAGVAAWTAPIIVTSVASPAAAMTPGAGGSGISCAQAIVYFKRAADETVYYTGYEAGSGCGSFGSFSAGQLGGADFCTPCNGVTYRIVAYAGDEAGSVGNVKYGASCASATNDATKMNAFSPAGGCSTYLSVSGGAIVAQPGVTILAVVAFNANAMRALCPTDTLPGNRVTIGDCAAVSGGGVQAPVTTTPIPNFTG